MLLTIYKQKITSNEMIFWIVGTLVSGPQGNSFVLNEQNGASDEAFNYMK